MKIILVGNRDGQAVINWLGVFASALIVATVSMAGAAAFMIAVSWYSPAALAVAVILGVASVVGIGVQRAFRLPMEQLKPLK